MPLFKQANLGLQSPLFHLTWKTLEAKKLNYNLNNKPYKIKNKHPLKNNIQIYEFYITFWIWILHLRKEIVAGACGYSSDRVPIRSPPVTDMILMCAQCSHWWFRDHCTSSRRSTYLQNNEEDVSEACMADISVVLFHWRQMIKNHLVWRWLFWRTLMEQWSEQQI